MRAGYRSQRRSLGFYPLLSCFKFAIALISDTPAECQSMGCRRGKLYFGTLCKGGIRQAAG